MQRLIYIATALLATSQPLYAQLTLPAPARDSMERCADCQPTKRLGLAAAEMFGFELMPYSYGRWVSKELEEHTTLQSWWSNLKYGWTFDNNGFPVNHFEHPYSGAIYFNSARSNGYGFWSSAPFAVTGSALWEYFGEVQRPSINDQVNTSLGGIILGEMLYRFSSVVLDDRATGVERVFRELGAGLLDPPRGLTRLLNGDASRRGANPVDRFPSRITALLEVGVNRLDRQVFRRPRPEFGVNEGFMSVALAYGDPLSGDVTHPFGAMRIEAMMAPLAKNSDSEIRALGFLAVHDLVARDGRNQQLALAMHYHYDNNRVFVTGGEGFSGGLISRYPLGRKTTLRTEMWLTGIPLGAVRSDLSTPTPTDTAHRSYDYGVGGGSRLLAHLDWGRVTIADVSYQPFWYHIISGVARSHFYDVTTLKLQAPLIGGTSLGIRQVLYRRVAHYNDDVTARAADGQTQLFAAFSF